MVIYDKPVALVHALAAAQPGAVVTVADGHLLHFGRLCLEEIGARDVHIVLCAPAPAAPPVQAPQGRDEERTEEAWRRVSAAVWRAFLAAEQGVP